MDIVHLLPTLVGEGWDVHSVAEDLIQSIDLINCVR